MTEHAEQSKFITWKRRKGMHDWRYNLIYAIPNEIKRPYVGPSSGILKEIDRAMHAIRTLYRNEGLEPGVPDVCFPFPSGPFHGLYIEFKFGKGKPSNMQQIWRDRLIKAGYLHFVCYSHREAILVTLTYLKLGNMMSAGMKNNSRQPVAIELRD